MKFNLGDKVKISISGEVGEVIGRAEYLTNYDPQYQVRYVSASGCAIEAWWAEQTLEAA